MADDKKEPRKRMVVEEVSEEPKEETVADSGSNPGGEIKEKVEELQEITEHMGEDIEKSEDVQEELSEAADKFVQKPVDVKEKPPISFQQPSRGPNPLIIIIPGLLLLGAILGGVYFYQKNLPASSQTETTSFDNMATEAPMASSTPEAILDLSKFQVKVENGSGVAGTAGSAKDLLTKAGFEVTSTGNADNYDYTDTIIQAKSTVSQAFLDKLQTELEGLYSVAKPETLDDSSAVDVVVIIGSSKSQ